MRASTDDARDERESRGVPRSRSNPLDGDIGACLIGPSERNEPNASFECQTSGRIKDRLVEADSGEDDPRCTTTCDHPDRLANEPHLVFRRVGNDRRRTVVAIHEPSVPGGPKIDERSSVSAALKSVYGRAGPACPRMRYPTPGSVTMRSSRVPSGSAAASFRRSWLTWT
jgi:hypothetical protein